MLPVTQTAMDGIGLSVPRVSERDAVPYLGIRVSGPMPRLPQFAPPKFPQLHGWMRKHGIDSGKVGFFRYRRFAENGDIELDVGTTTKRAEKGGGEVFADELPAGRYAVATYTGPYDRLYDAFAMLNGWIDGRNLIADRQDKPEGATLGCQLEIYRISPMQEKDPAKLETDLLVRLAD